MTPTKLPEIHKEEFKTLPQQNNNKKSPRALENLHKESPVKLDEMKKFNTQPQPRVNIENRVETILSGVFFLLSNIKSQ